MQGLFATLSDAYPKWKLGESRIGKFTISFNFFYFNYETLLFIFICIKGTNPGLSFRPIDDITSNSISVNTSSSKSISMWTGYVDEFLKRMFYTYL